MVVILSGNFFPPTKNPLPGDSAAVTELYPQTLGWSRLQPPSSGHENSPSQKGTFAELPCNSGFAIIVIVL